MHQAVTSAPSPERRGAHLLLSRLVKCVGTGKRRLDDEITGAYVVQQEIAEGMNDLAAERRRNRNQPAAKRGSRIRSSDRSHMTSDAALPGRRAGHILEDVKTI